MAQTKEPKSREDKDNDAWTVGVLLLDKFRQYVRHESGLIEPIQYLDLQDELTLPVCSTSCSIVPNLLSTNYRSLIATSRVEIPLMEEILHPAPVEVGSLSHFFKSFYTSQVVVWDFWTINSMVASQNTGWFIGILLMLYYNPYLTR